MRNIGRSSRIETSLLYCEVLVEISGGYRCNLFVCVRGGSIFGQGGSLFLWLLLLLLLWLLLRTLAVIHGHVNSAQWKSKEW